MPAPATVAVTVIAVAHAGKVATATAIPVLIATPVAKPTAAPFVNAHALEPTRLQLMSCTELTSELTESGRACAPGQPPSLTVFAARASSPPVKLTSTATARA